jgi:hypothetical protein
MEVRESSSIFGHCKKEGCLARLKISTKTFYIFPVGLPGGAGFSQGFSLPIIGLGTIQSTRRNSLLRVFLNIPISNLTAVPQT